MNRPRLALTLVALAACADKPAPPPPPPNPGNVMTAASGWYRGDLHFHTNYSEDAKAQGGDDLVPALAIADAYRDPVFLAKHPDWQGDGLDFVEVSDHRTDAALSDPGFHHEHLIVVPGEEYGTQGHANVIGLQKHIPSDATEGETQDQHHIASMAEAHRQGALFSVNHPCQDNRWPWDLENADGVEVWNGPWSAFYGETTLADLDAETTSTGAENPYIRAAVEHSGQGSNAQALWLWYGLLTRGHHPRAFGGSDRHMLLAPALPTNYVRRPDSLSSKHGQALGADGILAGMKEGATFISSSPHGPQVELIAEDSKGGMHPMGSDLKAGETYTLHISVSRAKGGLVRLIAGGVATGTGPVNPQPTKIYEQSIGDVTFTDTLNWQTSATGEWVHAIVLEPRIPEALPPELQQIQPIFDTLPKGKGLGDMVTVMGQIVDSNVIFNPAACDPANWVDWQGQCMPADKATWATFYLPLPVLRLMNTWFEDGKPTTYSMGAISSAFLAMP